jgi:hypothetical protein
MKSLTVAAALRSVEAYRLIDVLIIAGLTALVVIQVANFATTVA